ncbi:MAG: PaaI family thioesterase [Rhodospirillaceae bacterium]
MAERSLRLSKDELSEALDRAFPAGARPLLGELVSVAPGHVRMQLEPAPVMLRPGGIVSGPAQVALIDVAAYAVILAHIGAVEMAVTSTLSVNFLRACKAATMFVDARILRLGRRIASVDARIWQDAEDDLVAQATLTYAIPT